MIGTTKKTPKRPTGQKYKKVRDYGWRRPANGRTRAKTHNERHGKMGAREKATYALLREQRS